MTVVPMLHTVWARYHNHLPQNIKQVYKNWTSAMFFFEARKIAIVQFQIITYNVYIPLPIGPKTMQHHRINHLNAEYNNNLEDEVYTEFSAAAFRRVPDDVTGIPIVFYNNQYFFDKNYTGFTGEIKRSNGNRGRLKIPVSNV